MPGFSINGPGDVSNISEIRRNHRWHFTVLGSAAGFQWSREGLLYLKSAARPHPTFETPELHHDQEMARFAGKYSWEPITMTWYDIEQDPDVSASVYDWMQSVITVGSANVNTPAQYKSDAELAMRDGLGAETEKWTLFGSWPSDIDWGELDYTNTDLAEVTATLVFDRAERSA